MTQPQKHVLLADSDPRNALLLCKALGMKGYRATGVRDGGRVLEEVVRTAPDLVILDQRCAQLNTQAIIGVLRGNPRTENLPVIVIGLPEARHEKSRDIRDVFVARPYHVSDLLERVDGCLKRMAVATAMRGDGAGFEGDLKQMGLPDLLQVFGLNRRSGVLAIHGGDTGGRIYFADGAITDADCRGVRGEKALYRLLSVTDGRFSYDPSGTAVKRTIRAGIDGLLMEAMRQIDEIARVMEALPSGPGAYVLNPGAGAPSDGVSPVTEELAGILDVRRTFRELTDLCTATDYETARALKSLLDRGSVRFLPGDVAPAIVPSVGADEPLLRPHEAARFKAALKCHALGPYRLQRPKLLLLSRNPGPIKAFIRRLKAVPEFALLERPQVFRLGFGSIGMLSIDQECSVVLMVAPVDAARAPLLKVLAVGAVGGIIFAEAVPDALGESPSPWIDDLPTDLPVVHVAPRAGGDAGGTGTVSATCVRNSVGRGATTLDLGASDGLRALLVLTLLGGAAPVPAMKH